MGTAALLFNFLSFFDFAGEAQKSSVSSTTGLGLGSIIGSSITSTSSSITDPDVVRRRGSDEGVYSDEL